MHRVYYKGVMKLVRGGIDLMWMPSHTVTMILVDYRRQTILHLQEVMCDM